MLGGNPSFSQAPVTGNGYSVDPETGIAYAPVHKTIQKPVQETRMVQRQETTYTPRTVTETRPTTRTTYYPTTRTILEPYIANRWNPFTRPSVAYRFVPQTHWQAQTDVVNQTSTRTEYVAETTTRQVPETVNKIVREERVELEPLGYVGAAPAVAPGQAELAERLRPLGSGERIVPFSSGGTAVANRTTTAPRIASTTVGGFGSPSRSYAQGGHQATELRPQTGYGQALPPAAGGTGVATLPPLPMFR